MIGLMMGSGEQLAHALQVGFLTGLISFYVARMFLINWKWFWIGGGALILLQWGAGKTVVGAVFTIGSALIAGDLHSLFVIGAVVGALLAVELPCLKVRTLLFFGGRRREKPSADSVAVMRPGGVK